MNGLLLSIPHPSLNMGFVQITITKMANKMDATCQFALVDSDMYHKISFKFHIWTTFFNLSPKFEYEYCPNNDNQDGQQNGCRPSVCTCGHSNLDIYHQISSKFYIWTTVFILLTVIEYGFCPMNDNQNCCQNGYPLFTAGHFVGCFVGVHCSS